MQTEYSVVIPVRLESTRLPRKPLLDIAGKSMIHRTYDRVAAVVAPENIFIATDSPEIADHSRQFSQNILMTPKDCKTGTDRVAACINSVPGRSIVNVQGDEPIMPLANIRTIARFAQTYSGDVAIGYSEVLGQEEYYSNSVPKCVFNEKKELIYMSRAPIPGNKKGVFIEAFKQICVYSFSRNSLTKFSEWDRKSQIEEQEDIEILRLLEHNQTIRMLKMDARTVAVDTPADLERVRKIIESQGENLNVYEVS